MLKLGILHNNQEVLKRAEKEIVDYHLCQDYIDKLGIQEFVDSPWDVENGLDTITMANFTMVVAF